MMTIRTRTAVAVAASLIAAVPLVVPSAAVGTQRARVVPRTTPPGTLRFDSPRYATGGCVTATLLYAGGLTPALDLESKATGDHEHVALTHGAGSWRSTHCLHLGTAAGHPNDAKLQVAPGDTVFAFARNGNAVLAVGAFTISGTRTGQAHRPTLVVHSVTLPKGLATGPLGPNARITGPNGVSVYLAERAVIVSETAPGDLAGFLKRHHGKDLGSVSIGDPAAGGRTYHTVQIDPLSYNDTGFSSLLASDKVTKGTFTFSSVRARKLLALVTAEQIAGLAVWPETLQLGQSNPSTDEGPDGSIAHRDYFTDTWSNPKATDGSQRLRLGEAQGVLRLMKIPSGSFTHIAVLDGGFGGPNDFGGGFTPPDYGAPGGAFHNIPQCDIDFAGGTNCNPLTGPAQGPSNMPCQGGNACPWHGMDMASIAAGRLDNGAGGTAGVAAQTSDLHLYKLAFDYTLPLASGLSTAAKQGANVISISSGAPCKLGGIDLCDGATRAGLTVLCATLPISWMGGPLAVAAAAAACASLIVASTYDAISNGVAFAELSNVVVVAAGGNTHDDPLVDKLFPCVVTFVVCVGGLMESKPAPVAVPTFSFGSRINIWAPGNDVRFMPDPNSGGNTTSSGGTSPATAFIAGVVGIAKAIDPALSAAQLRSLLADTACRPGNTARTVGPACTPSSDATVNGAGYVDVLEVVRRARAMAGDPSLGICTGGFDESSTTGDSAGVPSSLGYFPAQLSGTFEDLKGIDSSLTDLDQSNSPLLPDERWYSFTLTGTIPLVKALTVKASITVPDVSLGILQLSFWRLVGNTVGPPTAEAVTASLSQDSSSGTAYVEAPIVIGSTYAVKVTTLGPISAMSNCFTELKLESLESAPNPPSHEPWLEAGGAAIYDPTGNAVDTRTMLVPVTLTGTLPYDVTVNYTFDDGSAIGGTDFSNTAGSVLIPSGATDAAIPVSIFPVVHAQEVFADVHISSPQAPTLQPYGWFAIEPSPGGGAVNAGDSNSYEGDGGGFKLAHVTVSLDQVTARPLTVFFTTHDDTAKAGTDYAAASGSVVIPAGSETADISILLSNVNTFPEPTKSFTVQLTNTSAGMALLGKHATATVTILDDDPRP